MMTHVEPLLVRPSQLAHELGVSKTTLWRWRQLGILPHPISLGPRIVGWRRSAIDDWLKSRQFEPSPQMGRKSSCEPM